MMHEILEALERAVAAGDERVLVTVVGSTGSVYRRAGAKSLLSPSGEAIGTISGGCLDHDLRERAGEILADRRPRLVSYDTRAMNDELFGLGLGCGGEVEAWMEPLDWWRGGEGRAALASIRQGFERGEATIVATVLRNGGRSVDRVERWLDSSATPGRRMLDDGRDVFIDKLVAARRMIVIGAGPDAEPLVELATIAGFEVTLVADRPDASVASRFPRARIHPGGINAIETVPLYGRPAIVLVTHRSASDRDALRMLLPRSDRISYLGLLGPKTRSRKLLDELAAEGHRPTEAALAKLYGPAGLDLGSESPAEIALSIVAEALAIANQRPARPLRDKAQ